MLFAAGKFSSQGRPSSAWIVERFRYFRALRSPLLIASYIVERPKPVMSANFLIEQATVPSG